MSGSAKRAAAVSPSKRGSRNNRSYRRAFRIWNGGRSRERPQMNPQNYWKDCRWVEKITYTGQPQYGGKTLKRDRLFPAGQSEEEVGFLCMWFFASCWMPVKRNDDYVWLRKAFSVESWSDTAITVRGISVAETLRIAECFKLRIILL